MKLADINNMDKISDEFENGSDRTNNRCVTSHPLIVMIAYEHSTGHVFSLINFNHSQNDDEMSVKFETGS